MNLTDLFKHENQPWPPSLAKSGHKREGTKSDLLDSLEDLSESQSESPTVDVKILDGAFVQSAQWLDIVLDTYKDDSLKAETRETRETGTHRRVMPSVHIPGNWQSFLQNNENKTELFALIAATVAHE